MKRKIALLLSFSMILTMFSSCGGNIQNNADTTSATEAITSATEASEAVDYFGEDYDPFSDDYDPYDGNGAVAAELNTETNIVSEVTEEASETKAETTSSSKSTSETKAASTTNTESKQSDSKQSSTAKNNTEKTSSDVSLVLNTANGWENGSDKFIQLIRIKQSAVGQLPFPPLWELRLNSTGTVKFL